VQTTILAEVQHRHRVRLIQVVVVVEEHLVTGNQEVLE
jgi:hypothetical protein